MFIWLSGHWYLTSVTQVESPSLAHQSVFSHQARQMGFLHSLAHSHSNTMEELQYAFSSEIFRSCHNLYFTFLQNKA